ncbi:MAG: hypothetical protein ABEJ64_01805 [Candidatus Nanohaloarchaea archaeon]
MDIGKKVEQYGVVIFGLLIGGGFAFGGIASYAGITGGGSNPQQQERPELPSQNVVDGGFDLSVREQAALAYRNDVVFVTVLEGNRSAGLDRQQLVSDFSGRVYVTSVDGEASTLATTQNITEFPRAVAVSAAVQRGRLVPRMLSVEPKQGDVTRAVCQVLTSWGSASATCSSLSTVR